MPLAVWPCAQDAADRAWGNRRAPFEIARRAIETYSQPGDLVLDPLCTDPSLPIVLEAIRQERNAAAVIGHDVEDFLELGQRVHAARTQGALGEAVLLRGDPPELPRLLARQEGFLRRHHLADRNIGVHPGGSADLILVSLPALLLLGRREDHSRRWHQRFSAFDVLTASAIVLRPGGYLVTVTGSGELEGTRRDLGAETVSLGEELGLAYWQHIIALLVPIDDGHLKPRRRRRAKQLGLPRIVHQDVHVFRKPTAETRLDNANTDARWAA